MDIRCCFSLPVHFRVPLLDVDCPLCMGNCICSCLSTACVSWFGSFMAVQPISCEFHCWVCRCSRNWLCILIESLDSRPLYRSTSRQLCVSKIDTSFFSGGFFLFLREFLGLRVLFSPHVDMLWRLPSPIEISHPKELALKGGQLPQVCSTLACPSKVHSWFVGIVYFVMVYELEVLVLL